MSKYVTAQEFEKWVERYYQEFCMNKDLVLTAFGDKTTKRRGIIVINKNNGKIAHSYCHSDDEWNYETGVAVAYAHYMGIEVPQVEKGYFIRDLVGKEVVLPAIYSGTPTTVFVTPYTKGGYVVVVNSYTGCTFRVHPHTLIRERDIKK
jgi:hypothetical protein